MNETYKKLTRALYDARVASQAINAELKEMRDAYEAEVKPKKDLARELSAEEDKAKYFLTAYAKDAYATNVLDSDGPVQIQNGTEIVIDEAKAMAWAKAKMPDAIIETLDMPTIKLVADKHPEWATITKYPKPVVASDLRKYIE